MTGGRSLARVLPAALLGATVLLAVLSGLGIAALYEGRQDYEDRVAEASALEVASATLLASAIAVEAGLERPRAGPRAAPARRALRAAARSFEANAARVVRLAAGDRASRSLAAPVETAREAVGRLARRAADPQARRRADRALPGVRAAIAALALRQGERRAEARDDAAAASRTALAAVAAAGGLALVAVLAFLTLLIRGMRSPLEALVAATQRVAGGDLDARVRPDGPQELRQLGTAFNAMADGLAGATARLRTERERLRTTIESLGDALVLTDADGTVTMVNPRATELLPELPPGAPATGTGSPLPPLAEALRREVVVEHGEEVLGITAARLTAGGGRGDGDGDGDREDAGVVWTARDVTERARLERAKREFVATASHELRSPLTSIKGFLELLMDPSADLSARQRRFLDIIAASTNRLVDLVNDLLDVARLEAGQFRLHRRPTDLRTIVEEVAALIEPRVAGKQQRLEVEVAEHRPVAFADPDRIRQILINLVTNAHLYTPAGGRITVSLGGDGDATRLEVRDTGRGMSRQDLGRVFDRFFRSEEVSRQEPGTGLGLSIVKSLVDLHEGKVDVESEVGRGTTFRVTLPGVPAGHLARGADVLRGRRVLVVEDEEAIAQLVGHHLAAAGVETAWAPSGDEALRLLRAGGFDAVTLDVFMPGTDGLEVLAQLRADPALRSTPVVVVSVAADHPGLAGEWVVPKPIDRLLLTDLLAEAVQDRRSRVLVAGGEAARRRLAPALDAAGVEHRWCADGPSAVRAAAAERFEVALIDAALPDAQDTVRRLELQGRRQGRALLVFSSDGDDVAGPTGVAVLPVAHAVAALQGLLAGAGAADRDLDVV